jgi:hypothetical protein
LKLSVSCRRGRRRRAENGSLDFQWNCCYVVVVVELGDWDC